MNPAPNLPPLLSLGIVHLVESHSLILSSSPAAAAIQPPKQHSLLAFFQCIYHIALYMNSAFPEKGQCGAILSGLAAREPQRQHGRSCSAWFSPTLPLSLYAFTWYSMQRTYLRCTPSLLNRIYVPARRRHLSARPCSMFHLHPCPSLFRSQYIHIHLFSFSTAKCCGSK
jgi:hypothetical protein